jgi:hypothetical protein
MGGGNPRLTIPSCLTVIDRCICQLVPYPQGVGLVSFSLKGAYVNAAFKMPTSRWLSCIPSFLVLEKSRGTNDVGEYIIPSIFEFDEESDMSCVLCVNWITSVDNDVQILLRQSGRALLAVALAVALAMALAVGLAPFA